MHMVLFRSVCTVSNLPLGFESDLCKKFVACQTKQQMLRSRCSVEDLREYLVEHDDGKRFGCASCGKRFQRPSELRRHIKTHTIQHSDNRPRFECPHCSRLYLSQGSLRKHKLIHTSDEKPFKCDHCEYRCRRKDHLENHIRVHSDDKEFSCTVCQRQFRQSAGLRQHMRLHSDKRYKCELCSKRFRHIDSLKYHKLIHEGRKPYGCKFCGRRFRSRVAYIRAWSIICHSYPL